MTNEERKQWIEACKELLVKYKNGTHDASGRVAHFAMLRMTLRLTDILI